MKEIIRKPTRAVKIGSVVIGDNNPIAVQSMTSTHTTDVDGTIAQIKRFESVGVDIVRVAVDSMNDANALSRIRGNTSANLVVDLQESYRLVKVVAPYVNKIRYNPGHLYHHEVQKSWDDKVKFIAEYAARYNCSLRVGVNSGSIDPDIVNISDPLFNMMESALRNCAVLDKIGFSAYCVSLKHSDPGIVVDLNKRFAEQRPDVPLHIGVTEAGLPEYGIDKSKFALEQLICSGIGDTIRVSLTLPNDRKFEEILVGKRILAEIYEGVNKLSNSFHINGINLISCPSCSRVENKDFVDLATKVSNLVNSLEGSVKKRDITIATMGCRVNGPGETDNADIGLWCGPSFVHLKRGSELVGKYPYDKVLEIVKEEIMKIMVGS